ncbi:ABC transporter ATP-binding protein [Myxococcota bacterium]|nr:ABC transporter ATP-binding protein [Myxococcota bacterium]
MTTWGSTAVELSNISKRYLACVANQGASLVAKAGEVHAVVGENGAGKSTLMKVLYGLVTPDEGRIVVRGRELVRHSPADAIDAGVGMVFQHFMLVPPLTVAENIVLGREPKKGLTFDRGRAIEQVLEVSDRFGLEINPKLRVEDCSVGLQQRVEILKVLLRGAEVIILDEPTAVLTPQEIDELMVVTRRLAREGKTILLITHKLREVMAASDRVTIMRQGRTIETLETAKTSVDEIAEKMVGRAIERPKRVRQPPAGIVLSVKGLSATSDRGVPGLVDVSIDVRAGEILGIAGIEGNGQTELVECIAGLRRPTAGTITIAGEDLTHASVRARLDAGLAHVPEDRHRRAVVLDLTVEENAILGSQPSFGGALSMDFARIRAHAEAIIAGHDVRPRDPTQKMRALSGGNQQKVVIGRETARRPKLLLAAHPTRGLDIGAIHSVESQLEAARAAGTAIVLVSGELSELLAMSDRMIVMFGGRILGEVDPAKVDERTLGLLMAGHVDALSGGAA